MRIFSRSLNAFTLFVLWPLAGLIYSVINYRQRYAKNILWLFCSFFGFTLVISNEGLDSAFYRDNFLEHGANDDFSFIAIINSKYSYEILDPLISQTTALFSSDYRVLFAVYGLVFGYFYSRNIFYLIDLAGEKIRKEAFLLLGLFIFLVPFWNINGFRFYCATQIFVFGALRVLFERNWWGYFICLMAPLMHFAFILPAGLIFIHRLTNYSKIALLSLVILLTLVLSFDVSNLANTIPELSGQVSEKVARYSNTQYIEAISKLSEKTNWYVYGRNLVLNIALGTFVFFLLLFYTKQLRSLGTLHILSFGLLLFSFGMYLSAVPSMSRFITVGHLFIAAGLFVTMQRIDRTKFSVAAIGYVLAVPIILFAVVEVRIGFDLMGPGLLFTNPLIVAFFEYNIPLIDLLPGSAI